MPSTSNILKRLATATFGLHLDRLKVLKEYLLHSVYEKDEDDIQFNLINMTKLSKDEHHTLEKLSWWAGPIGHGWWTLKENPPEVTIKFNQLSFMKVYLKVVPHLDNLILCESWLLVRCLILGLGSFIRLEWLSLSNIWGLNDRHICLCWRDKTQLFMNHPF